MKREKENALCTNTDVYEYMCVSQKIYTCT